MALRPLLACALCLRAAGGSGGHCRPREGVAAVGGPPSREHLLVQSRLQLDGPSEAAARRPPGANFTAELSFWESAQHRDSASGASLPAAASASGAGWCQAAAPAADWRPRGACGRRRVVALTFNLNWWRLYDQMNGGKVAEVVAASAPYDFLGFQECDDVERVLADAGLAGDYSGLQGSHALALVYRKSRWLLLASGEADVAEDMRDQYYGRRGVQWARFQSLTGGPPVTFLNHQGPMPVGTGGRCGEMATAHNILHTIKAQAEAGDGVLLVGDFSAPSGSEAVRELQGRLHKVYSGSALREVDHVFSNCGPERVLSARNLGNGGSDHDALRVEIDL